MAKSIKCPKCSSKGTIHNEFEARGKWEGKMVLMCSSCGRGLTLGGFSYMLGKKPEVIPDARWDAMKQEWDRSFS